MNENTVNLGIDSTLKEYHKGDHIFAVDFGKNANDDKPSFQIHEYEIKSVINSHFENAEGIFYNIADVNHPKVEIKTNLLSGYFTTPKEAADEFISSMEYILEEARRSYSEQFGN